MRPGARKGHCPVRKLQSGFCSENLYIWDVRGKKSLYPFSEMLTIRSVFLLKYLLDSLVKHSVSETSASELETLGVLFCESYYVAI